MKVGVIGAGAFGTSLALAMAGERRISLWARDMGHLRDHRRSRKLPDFPLPDAIDLAGSVVEMDVDVCLLSVPMQNLEKFLEEHGADLRAQYVVLCCKGIALETGRGPVDILKEYRPDLVAAVLSGPSFAVDIAAGKPTALTLATAEDADGVTLQNALSAPMLRLYRTDDVVGVQLGGALKNVIAIGCGAAIGAGYGDSARSALITRGFAEMSRFAVRQGARADTLAGLSGLGDLVLTCTSDKSRNYRYGVALGAGQPFDQATTVEGAATARVLRSLAERHAVEMPVCAAIAEVISGNMGVDAAMEALLARPLRQE